MEHLEKYVYNRQTQQFDIVPFEQTGDFYVYPTESEWDEMRFKPWVKLNREGVPVEVPEPPTEWHDWNPQTMSWDAPSDERKDEIISEVKTKIVNFVNEFYTQVRATMPNNHGFSYADAVGDFGVAKLVRDKNNRQFFEAYLGERLTYDDFMDYYTEATAFETVAEAVQLAQDAQLAEVHWLQNLHDCIDYHMHITEKLKYFDTAQTDMFEAMQLMVRDYLNAKKQAEETKARSQAPARPKTQPKQENKDDKK